MINDLFIGYCFKGQKLISDSHLCPRLLFIHFHIYILWNKASLLRDLHNINEIESLFMVVHMIVSNSLIVIIVIAIYTLIHAGYAITLIKTRRVANSVRGD